MKRKSPGFHESDSPEKKRIEFSNYQPNLTKFIKSKNNQSTDLFRSVCISNIQPKITDQQLEESIEKIFLRFGSYNLSITTFGGERVAYVNFSKPSNAFDALQELETVEIEGKPVSLRPIYHSKESLKQYGNKSRSPIRRQKNHSEINSGSEHSDSHHLSETPIRNLYKDKSHQKLKSRTLFVGNLGFNIKKEDLFNRFKKFGKVLDVELKSNKCNQFAFVTFPNLYMADQVRNELDGQILRGSCLKIGFANEQITPIVFVGGLGRSIDFDDLEAEVFQALGERKGIKRINWPHNKPFAFIECDNEKKAKRIVDGMQKPITAFDMGFSDEADYRANWAEMPMDTATAIPNVNMSHHSISNDTSRQDSARRINSPNRSRGISSSHRHLSPEMNNPNIRLNPKQLIDLNKQPSWSGKINMQNNQYGVSFYRVRGNNDLTSRHLILNNAFQSPQPVEVNFRRVLPMKSSKPHYPYSSTLSNVINLIDKHKNDQYCLYVVVGSLVSTTLIDDARGKQKPLVHLSETLQNSQIIAECVLDSNIMKDSLEDKLPARYARNDGALILIPPSTFSYHLLKSKFPNVEKPDVTKSNDYMLVMLLDGVAF